MPNLDFVRSIAVVSVVVEHTLLALGITQVGPFPIPYLGVLGVMVFFVLTSLVLMWSLERKPHTLDFYIRRWFRIFPLAIAVIVITLLTHAQVGVAPFGHPSLRDVVIQLALMQDMLPVSTPIVGVMWTLPYEVHMYVLLPMIFFFVRKNFALWPLLVLWCLVIVGARSVPGHNFAVAIGYFLPGVMAYVAFGRWQPRLPSWTLPLFLLAIFALFLLHCNFHRLWYFCLVFGLALPLFRQLQWKPLLAVSRQIAKYSYGIYLTHPFAVLIGLYLLRQFSLPLRLLAELILLVVLPVIAYHLLEHPMIRLGARLAGKAESNYEQREMKHYRGSPVV